jgi:hypothetical protein
MEKKEIHFTLDGDAGENNTIVNMVIEKAYNVNPTAKVVNNTFNIGTRDEASAAISEAMGAQPTPEQSKSAMPKTLLDTIKEPEEGIDCSVIRQEILIYVSRIRPLVAPDKKDRFMKMWEGILDLDAVKSIVYKTGKQKETNFNRKLIANIIHHLDSRKMYANPFKASDFAMALEQDSEKSVRGELGKFPSDHVCAEIDNYLESQNLWHKV